MKNHKKLQVYNFAILWPHHHMQFSHV